MQCYVTYQLQNNLNQKWCKNLSTYSRSASNSSYNCFCKIHHIKILENILYTIDKLYSTKRADQRKIAIFTVIRMKKYSYIYVHVCIGVYENR